MPILRVYIENGVAMAHDSGSAAWVYDLPWWGCCGQGVDDVSALADITRILGTGFEVCVAERIYGDEQAFDRDRQPASYAERAATLNALGAARAELLDLLQTHRRDLDRDLPQKARFASWTTIRERAWHIADTESRYYMPALGLRTRPREPDLLTELAASAAHVREEIVAVPADRAIEGRETWTTVKLLRRLAWHERGELAAMRTALEK